MAELIRDANEDGDGDNSDNGNVGPTQAVPPTHRRSRTATQRRISLALLFSFTDLSTTTSLEFYWKGGLKNMQRETAAYDMIHDEVTIASINPERGSNVEDSGVFLQ
jgi:hypothetical protein